MYSYYKVFAVPTTKELDPITGSHHFVPVMRSAKLLAQADLPLSLAKKHKPAPFLVRTYTVKNLPATIVFDGKKMSLRLSFKPNTYYTFVVAVFSNATVSFVAVM